MPSIGYRDIRRMTTKESSRSPVTEERGASLFACTHSTQSSSEQEYRTVSLRGSVGWASTPHSSVSCPANFLARCHSAFSSAAVARQHAKSMRLGRRRSFPLAARSLPWAPRARGVLAIGRVVMCTNRRPSPAGKSTIEYCSLLFCPVPFAIDQ